MMASIDAMPSVQHPVGVAIPNTSRVRFTLDDGSEVTVRLTSDGMGLAINNPGSREPQGLTVQPVASNAVEVRLT